LLFGAFHFRDTFSDILGTFTYLQFFRLFVAFYDILSLLSNLDNGGDANGEEEVVENADEVGDGGGEGGDTGGEREVVENTDEVGDGGGEGGDAGGEDEVVENADEVGNGGDKGGSIFEFLTEMNSEMLIMIISAAVIVSTIVITAVVFFCCKSIRSRRHISKAQSRTAEMYINEVEWENVSRSLVSEL